MSTSAALAILALCKQGKFRIRGKADWTEPLNLFVVVVADPSERKSAVISLMTRPVNAFEADYNRQNAAELETSKMNKRILERRQRALEDKAAKDNTLIFSLINRETIVKRWKDRSRSESWTPEMRAAVGKKTKERSKQNGNS